MFDCAVLSSLSSPSWILRFRPWKFLANSKKLSANLENVRQASICQTVPKFWFICLFYSFSKKLIYWNAKGDMKSQTLEPFVIRRSASLFDFSELAKSCQDWNLKIKHWTSVDLNGLKNGTLKHFLASNQYISSKD